MSVSVPPIAPSSDRRGLPVIVAVGVLLALLGGLLFLFAGVGPRGGLWLAGVAPRLLTIGSWIAFVGGVLSLLAAGLTRPGTGRRGFGLSLVGVLVGLGCSLTHFALLYVVVR